MRLWKSSGNSPARAVRSWRYSERSFAWDTAIKKTLSASEQNRPDVQRHRQQWLAEQERLDAARLVFIDESGAKTNMTRLRGRARAGQRVVDYTPYGRWSTVTLISSIRLDGTKACMTVDGATTQEVFREYLRQVLCPTLRPGDIVIADNLSAHKNQSCSVLINNCGATLRFLPPYSPDFNPIENMWSKIKQSLRSAKARTPGELDSAIARALKTVTAADAHSYFFSCGYTTSHS
jgi:transposase